MIMCHGSVECRHPQCPADRCLGLPRHGAENKEQAPECAAIHPLPVSEGSPMAWRKVSTLFRPGLSDAATPSPVSGSLSSGQGVGLTEKSFRYWSSFLIIVLTICTFNFVVVSGAQFQGLRWLCLNPNLEVRSSRSSKKRRRWPCLCPYLDVRSTS